LQDGGVQAGRGAEAHACGIYVSGLRTVAVFRFVVRPVVGGVDQDKLTENKAVHAVEPDNIPVVFLTGHNDLRPPLHNGEDG
jgi:hypothetical protein